MREDTPFRVLALIGGIVLIIAGAGLALTGHTQTQAAVEWDQQVHDCGSAGSFEEASRLECPDNPYAGGEVKMAVGVGLAVIGGLATRYGTQ